MKSLAEKRYLKLGDFGVKNPEKDARQIIAECQKAGIKPGRILKDAAKYCKNLSKYALNGNELANWFSRYAGDIVGSLKNEKTIREFFKELYEQTEALSYKSRGMALNQILYAPLVIRMYAEKGKNPLQEFNERHRKLWETTNHKPVLHGYSWGPAGMRG